MGYAARTDLKHGVAVWCWLGSHVSAEQWSAHLQDMRRLRGWQNGTKRPCVIIHLLDNSFLPNAQQRQQIANESAHADYTPALAVVTSNPLVRGVMQALTWLSPSQAYLLDFFPDLPSALRWLGTQRGEPLPQLLSLLEEAHMELGVARNKLDDMRRALR